MDNHDEHADHNHSDHVDHHDEHADNDHSDHVDHHDEHAGQDHSDHVDHHDEHADNDHIDHVDHHDEDADHDHSDHVDHHDEHADHDLSDHGHDHSHELHQGHDKNLGPSHKLLGSPHNPVHDHQTWIAAIGSILLISLCGIFGILVIPIMQKVFYQHLIQFLIALAVGTLAGDALLHLLPHAFMAAIPKGPDSHGHDHHNHEQHTQAVWLGFVATVSLIGFFLFEKCVNVLAEIKEANKQRNSPRVSDKKLRVMREGHVASDRMKGDNICKNKYSNYCAKDLEEGSDVQDKDIRLLAWEQVT